MANAFTLFGELKADTSAFERSLKSSDALLKQTASSVEKLEKEVTDSGKTTATTARQFEKFNETIQQQKQRLLDAAEAYQKGEIGARKFASVINQTENKATTLNSRLKDTKARLTDVANSATRAGSMFKNVFGGTLLAGGVSGMATAVKDFAVDSVKLFGTLDKLTRFTSTLDKNFQAPQALKKFQEDIKKLSLEIPHSAENIAKASFTIKSAYANMQEPELIDFLREFGNQATASNTDIATHAFNMAALAKQYKITRDELPKFGALMATAFGAALSSDAKVAEGFNRILSSVLSLHQPIEDMAAAMGTLQSVSSDAESNTTNLLNVYAKLTDKKYIAGIQGMGVAVFDTAGKFRPLAEIVSDLSEKLKGLNDQEVNDKLSWAKDQQAREGLKTLVREVETYKKLLADGANEEAFKAKNELMLNSVDAKWERFTNKWENFKMNWGALFVDIAEYDLGGEIHKAVEKGREPAKQEGFSLGTAVAIGMGQGMGSMAEYVAGEMRTLVAIAIAEARTGLAIHSPSKVFHKIGQEVGQGFIDGIASMKTGVEASMVSLLDISKVLKKLGKNDAPGVQLLTSLIKELDELSPRTKLEEVQAELTAGKYKKLNAQVRDRIILAAKQLDLEERRNQLLEKYKGLADGLSDQDFPDMPAFAPPQNDGGTGLGDDWEKAGEAAEKMQDAVIALIGIPPPPADVWMNFWQGMHHELERFRDSLPSINEALGTNLVDSIAGIGDVFANAVSRWDGTAKGFFQSLASGFAQMAQRIIADLIRIMVMQTIMKIIGGFAGGGGGGGGVPGTAGSTFRGITLGTGGFFGGHKAGGYTGNGSTSAFAGFVHGKEFVMNASAVKKWGINALEQMNAGMTPPMAMASGGTSNNYSNSWSPTINIQVPAGSSQQTRASAEQGVRMALRELEKQRRRSK